VDNYIKWHDGAGFSRRTIRWGRQRRRRSSHRTATRGRKRCESECEAATVIGERYMWRYCITCCRSAVRSENVGKRP